jgi:hypothetical protein
MADFDTVTGWLIDECRDAGRRISDVRTLDEKVVATGVTVIGLAGTVAVAQGKPYLLMALPSAFAALYCFIAYRYAEAFAVSGYKAVLERAIAERLGGIPIDAWESEIAPSGYDIPSTLVLGTVMTLAFAGACALAILQAFKTRDLHHWGHANSTLLISLTIGSIVAGVALAAAGFWQAAGARRRAMHVAETRLFPSWVNRGASHAQHLTTGD